MRAIDRSDVEHLKKISNIMYNAGRSAVEDQQQKPLSVFMGEEFCTICTTPNNLSYTICPICFDASNSTSKDLRPDRTVFLTYAIKGFQSGLDVRNYKDGFNASPPSTESVLRLQILVAFFTQYHAPCLRESTGVGMTGFTIVPSAAARKEHPLETQLAVYFPIPRVSLERIAEPRKGREKGIDPDRYRVSSDVQGQHILVLEDTWVTGSQALSVAASLKKAGAKAVSILSVARFLDPQWPTTRQWIDRRTEMLNYDPRFCPVTKSFVCP